MIKYARTMSIILMLLLGFAKSATLVVTQNDSIQAAIDVADPGDIVLVESGIYYENVNINKTLNLKGIDMPLVDGGGNGSAITLSSDGIVIEGLSTQSESSEETGIEIISNNNTIRFNKVENCGLGIYLYNSSNNTIEANDIGAVKSGINISGSYGNKITSNNVIGSDYGIYLNESQRNDITGNNASYNKYGLILRDSTDNSLKNNSMWGNLYNFDSSGENEIDTSNTVDGKAVYYLIGKSDIIIDSASNVAGVVYCFYCSNVTVRGQSFANNSRGVFFHNTNGSRFENNTASNNLISIELKGSVNNVISNNSILNSEDHGIYLQYSDSNILVGNNVSLNGGDGIDIENSASNVVDRNWVRNNKRNGVRIHNSTRNVIALNSISSKRYGIYISGSYGNNVTSNNITSSYYGIYFDGSQRNYAIANDVSYDNNHGLFLNMSSNNTITDSNASFNKQNGIYLRYSDNNIFYLNNCSMNKLDGIRIDDSKNNTLMNCTAAFNAKKGIEVTRGNDFNIIGCTAINNSCGIYLYESGNITVIESATFLNNECGIKVYNTIGSALIGNNASKNLENGIEFSKGNSRDNEVRENYAAYNHKNGILLISLTYSNITGNNASNNGINASIGGRGIVLIESNNNSIIKNNIKYNRISGSSIERSSNNSITGNIAEGNLGGGIVLLDSMNNGLEDNIAENNSGGLAVQNSLHTNISSNSANNNTIGLYINILSCNQIKGNIISNNRVGVALNLSGNISECDNISGDNEISNNKKDILINANMTTAEYGLWEEIVLAEHNKSYLKPYGMTQYVTAGTESEHPDMSTNNKAKGDNKRYAKSGGESSEEALPPQTVEVRPVRPDLWQLVQDALEQISVHCPEKMYLDDQYEVSAAIEPENGSILGQFFGDHQTIRHKGINVTPGLTYCVEVEENKNFTITPMGGYPPDQLYDPQKPPVWRWFVTPQRESNQTLRFIAYVVLGSQSRINMSDFPVYVMVRQKNWGDYLNEGRTFIKTEYKWIYSVIGGAAIGAIWVVIRWFGKRIRKHL